MKPKYKRFFIGIFLILSLSVAFFWIGKALKSSLVYYVKPKELESLHHNKIIRVGGIVNSWDKEKKSFILKDGEGSVLVVYKNELPILFKENQEAVVEGNYGNKVMLAYKVFAKHDQNYFPKEVVEKLKSAGQWRGN